MEPTKLTILLVCWLLLLLLVLGPCDGATASQMPHLAHPMITCYFR